MLRRDRQRRYAVAGEGELVTQIHDVAWEVALEPVCPTATTPCLWARHREEFGCRCTPYFWAARYGAAPLGGPVAAGPVAQLAARTALDQVGTPYVWGGEEPGGFDCSGLVRYAYAAAGLALPRVAQDQYDAGPTLSADATLTAGDLLFFGTGPQTVDHVGMYLGDGRMVPPAKNASVPGMRARVTTERSSNGEPWRAAHDADLCRPRAPHAALGGLVPPTNHQQTTKRPDRRLWRSGLSPATSW